VIFEFGTDGRQTWRYHDYNAKEKAQLLESKPGSTVSTSQASLTTQFFQQKERTPSARSAEKANAAAGQYAEETPMNFKG